MNKPNFIEVELDPAGILKDLEDGGEDVKAAFFGSLKKIHAMQAMEELGRGGLRWEKLEGRLYPGTKQPLYSYRLNRNWRVVCLLKPGPIVEILWVADHDQAY